MKTRFYVFSSKLAMLSFSIVIGILLLFSACKEDNLELGEAYFSIEGEPTNLNSTAAGITQSYVVRSNGKWLIVSQDDSIDWVKVFPKEGQDDGTFMFTVNENTTPYERNTSFSFVIDDKEQPVLFNISQESVAPFLIITDTLDVETDIFKISGISTQFRINISSNGNSTYIIEDDWLTVVSDSSHCIILNAKTNPDEINARSTNINFVVQDFPELSQTIKVEQASFSPEIKISGINNINELDFDKAGGEIKLNVTTNDWSCLVKANDWLTLIDESKSHVTLRASENNTGIQRSTKVNFAFNDFGGGKEVTVIQYAGVVLLSEDFEWVADISYNDNHANEKIYCYTTGPRYDFWEAAGVDLSTLKWTTTLIDNTTSFYAQKGYVKLGKTRVCADIIFNKIASIQGEVKLKISFKAAAYVTANGNQNDDRLLRIEALNNGYPNIETFEINNFPEKGTHDNPVTYNVVWEENRTWRFVVSRATSETQIRFLAGEAEGSTASTNRISLDDIKIEY